MNHERTEQELAQWETYIGKFIIACGTIEKCTYELLQQLPTEDLSRMVLRMGLTERIELVCDLLPQRVSNEALVVELCDKLKQVNDRISLRNTIAHNPVDLSLYMDGGIAHPKQVVSKYNHDIEKMRK